MKLPKIIADLVNAQDNFDSVAYANCFSVSAVVSDERKKYQGKTEIQHWVIETNEKYKTVMTPTAFLQIGTVSILTATISGKFDGSPIVLQYHFELEDGLIQSLKITG